MNANVYDKNRVPDAPQTAKTPAKTGSAEWLAIAGLLALSFIPVASGAFRLNQLSGAEITPANARFFASPLPVVVHIASSSLFAMLGAFQFSTGFRRRWLRWHRVAGRLLVLAGLLVGLSGMWMALFYYPRPIGDGDLLSALRLLFGSAMIGSIVLSFTAIRRRDVRRHRAWMMRGYAIGLGAGTQTLTLMIGEMIAGKPNEFSRALLMGLAWLINLAVAEWIIRNRSASQARTA
ncbi:MAG TPA: DUF2306 domain-containing protein [Anaerolineae bacterium]|nr:DUF2306 domain-containing protein [Anaerolineae bacterium]